MPAAPTAGIDTTGAPVAEDATWLGFVARRDAALIDALPVVGIALFAVHLGHAVVIGLGEGVTAEGGSPWGRGLVAVHAAQAAWLLVVASGIWFGRRASRGVDATPSQSRALLALAAQYLAITALISGIDQLNDLPPTSFLMGSVALALVTTLTAPQAGLLYLLGLAVAGAAINGAQDDNARRLSALVQCLGTGGIGFAVTRVTTLARFRHYRLERENAAHVAALGESNARLREEIERRREAEAELRELAERDPLTRLYNRRAFTRAPELASTAGRRVGPLLVDVDHFKRVNDDHGHPAGDRALAAVAAALQESVRTDDTVARLGGEEFGIVVRVGGDDELRMLAEGIRSVMARTGIEGMDGRLTVSVGATLLRIHEVPDTAVARADAALYQAKNDGRDRVVVAPIQG